MCSKPPTSFVVRDDVSAAKYCNSRTIARSPQPIVLTGANSNKQTEFLHRIHFISEDTRIALIACIEAFASFSGS
jgi:hypothetical protein